MKKLIALIALTSAVTVQAQTTYFTDGQQDTIYTTGQPIKSYNNGLVITQWFKFVSKYENKYAMVLFDIHCPSGRYRQQKDITYVNGGNLAYSWQNPNQQWELPVPESIGATLPKVCASIR